MDKPIIVCLHADPMERCFCQENLDEMHLEQGSYVITSKPENLKRYLDENTPQLLTIGKFREIPMELATWVRDLKGVYPQLVVAYLGMEREAGPFDYSIQTNQLETPQRFKAAVWDFRGKLREKTLRV